MSLNPIHPLASNPALVELLTSLHALSLQQETETHSRGTHFPKKGDSSDKFEEALVALDEDKCRFLYLILTTMGATRIVEAGTSYGVSLLWLIAAIEKNLTSIKLVCSKEFKPLLIGTEISTAKANIALNHVKSAFGEVPKFVNLLVGDLLVTLDEEKEIKDRSIDALILDIWAELSLPTLKIMLSKLRKGGVVFIDNSVASAGRYTDLLSFIRAEGSGFSSETIPFSGGFEMAVYDP